MIGGCVWNTDVITLVDCKNGSVVPRGGVDPLNSVKAIDLNKFHLRTAGMSVPSDGSPPQTVEIESVRTEEHDAQVDLFRDHIDVRLVRGAVAFAIGNGGKRYPKVAKEMKAEGVKAGVPDIYIIYRRKSYFLEMKKLRGGRVSKEQKVMMARGRRQRDLRGGERPGRGNQATGGVGPPDGSGGDYRGDGGMTVRDLRDAEIARLRLKQSETVMAMIGPLLDASDGTPGDVKSYVREHCSSLCYWLRKIDNGMTGDEK